MKFNQSGLLEKMFTVLLVGMGARYSTRYKLTWKLKATKSGRSYYQLQVSTPRTKDTVSGLLPTPLAHDTPHYKVTIKNNRRITGRGSVYSMGLEDMAIRRMLPTPAKSDYKQRCKTKNRRGHDLVSTAQEITGQAGLLNPRFVAEMMGFPPDWTKLPFQNGEVNR